MNYVAVNKPFIDLRNSIADDQLNKKCLRCVHSCKQHKFSKIVQCPDYAERKRLTNETDNSFPLFSD